MVHRSLEDNLYKHLVCMNIIKSSTMDFEKTVLCRIIGVIVVSFLIVCTMKHYCFPPKSNHIHSRSIKQHGARGIVTTIPKEQNPYENMEGGIIDDML